MFRAVVYIVGGRIISDEFVKREEAQEFATGVLERNQGVFEIEGYQVKEKKTRKRKAAK